MNLSERRAPAVPALNFEVDVDHRRHEKTLTRSSPSPARGARSIKPPTARGMDAESVEEPPAGIEAQPQCSCRWLKAAATCRGTGPANGRIKSRGYHDPDTPLLARRPSA